MGANMRGVLIGADSAMEWCFRWWFEHYSKHNDFPVTVIDFGLSAQGLHNAKIIGHVIPCECASPKNYAYKPLDHFYVDKKRPIWFSKPRALTLTPYQHTVWIDIDCEVRGSIAPLFDYCTSALQFSAVQSLPAGQIWAYNNQFLKPGEILYNGGVIAYDRDSNLLHKWVEQTRNRSERYFADDVAFSSIIAENNLVMDEIPKEYNRPWHVADRMHDQIIHWKGPSGQFRLLSKVLNATFC